MITITDYRLPITDYFYETNPKLLIMNIEPEAFLKMTYGLFVVCSRKDKRVNGYISNSVFQVTAEPPQFAIACNKDNLTNDFIADSRIFTVSVLKKDANPKIIGTFGFSSGKKKDKFGEFLFGTSPSGVPYLKEDTVAWFECRVGQQLDAGTHMIYVGEVTGGELIDEFLEPLTYSYYRDVKKGLAPKNAPTYIDPKKLGRRKEKFNSDRYVCPNCGYIYDPAKGDPDAGIAPGTAFEELPDDWICPVCGTPKEDFFKQE